tara:strand:- start:154 stop:447 length:294 start_codon:yes stop_codon:yes gene_type:complete
VNIDPNYVVMNGSPELVRAYLEKNSDGDPALAETLKQSLLKEAGKFKWQGVAFMLIGIIGIPLLGLGLILMAAGLGRIFVYKRKSKIIEKGYSLFNS